MKTEYEIKEELEKSIKYWDGGRTKEVLKWVLGEPEYKRTIFELTDEEVQKLIKIIDPFSKDKIKEIKQFESPISKCIHIVLDGLYNEWTIYNDLDVHYWRDKRSPNNICQFIDTIRGMLSMEKPK